MKKTITYPTQGTCSQAIILTVEEDMSDFLAVGLDTGVSDAYAGHLGNKPFRIGIFAYLVGCGIEYEGVSLLF